MMDNQNTMNEMVFYLNVDIGMTYVGIVGNKGMQQSKFAEYNRVCLPVINIYEGYYFVMSTTLQESMK